MRYALFSGSDYHPKGGWKDAQCVSENIELLKQHCNDHLFDENWAHIVDIQDWIVMCEAKAVADGYWIWTDFVEKTDAST